MGVRMGVEAGEAHAVNRDIAENGRRAEGRGGAKGARGARGAMSPKRSPPLYKMKGLRRPLAKLVILEPCRKRAASPLHPMSCAGADTVRRCPRAR